MLGVESVGFLGRVSSGGTVYTEAEVLEVRESRCREGFRVMEIWICGVNQRGEEVVEFDRLFMVRKRDAVWMGEIREEGKTGT
jgi:Acyl dehydratase